MIVACSGTGPVTKAQGFAESVSDGMRVRLASSSFGTYQLGASSFTGEGFTFEVLCEQPGVIAVAVRWYVPMQGSSNGWKSLDKAIGMTLMEGAKRSGFPACAWTEAEEAVWLVQPNIKALLASIPCGQPMMTGLAHFP